MDSCWNGCNERFDWTGQYLGWKSKLLGSRQEDRCSSHTGFTKPNPTINQPAGLWHPEAADETSSRFPFPAAGPRLSVGAAAVHLRTVTTRHWAQPVSWPVVFSVYRRTRVVLKSNSHPVSWSILPILDGSREHTRQRRYLRNLQFQKAWILRWIRSSSTWSHWSSSARTR